MSKALHYVAAEISLALGLIAAKDGVPSRGWLKGFRKSHEKLVLRRAQALPQSRARNLCLETVASFYENLEVLYNRNNYSAHQIWNCDESGAQAGHDGGGYVLVKRGSKDVYKVTPDQREWLFVLSCINANNEKVPNFYIFKGKRKRKDFLRKAGEPDAAIAMQPKAYMMNNLFKEWMHSFLL